MTRCGSVKRRTQAQGRFGHTKRTICAAGRQKQPNRCDAACTCRETRGCAINRDAANREYTERIGAAKAAHCVCRGPQGVEADTGLRSRVEDGAKHQVVGVGMCLRFCDRVH